VTYETLLVDVREGVASVTLNRPEVRNALSATLIRELEQALVTLEADPEARGRGMGCSAASTAAIIAVTVPSGRCGS